MAGNYTTYMGHPYDPMRSRPVKLEWAGWVTDTHRLGQAGWSVSAHQDIRSLTMLIAIDHPQYAARGMTRVVDEWLYDHGGDYGRQVDHVRLPIGVRLGNRVEVALMDRPTFIPVETTPSLRHEIHSLEDLAHFAPAKNLSAPFVLPAYEVDDLMALILKKQEKAKTDYFRDAVAREGSTLPDFQHAAQIITLRDAA